MVPPRSGTVTRLGLDMTDRSQEIPSDQLPEGFAESLDGPAPTPADPRPAATIVLLRDGEVGLEVLLLRRNRKTGFVPGAWVFPGGRVDRQDRDLVTFWAGLDPATASSRLNLASAPDDPQALAYYTAALREAFEETGVLVGATAKPATQDPSSVVEATLRAREGLMDGSDSFLDFLRRIGAKLDGGRVEYIAHWVTPVREPRRYDTRFFAARVDPTAQVSIDKREMTAARWLRPDAALALHGKGELPMVFPTIRTIEDLTGFKRADEVLEAYRDREIPRILPTLVRTSTGVGLKLP